MRIHSIFCLLFTATFAFAQVNVLTANYDNQRTNANLQETILNPPLISSTTFGKIASLPVDGQIYAQPLFASGIQVLGAKHDVVFAVTMHNSVYAFDADAAVSTALLWQVNLGPSVPSAMLDNLDDIVPEVGILSTPVIDLSRQVIYMVSETLDSSQTPAFQLHALSIANGHEVMNGPVTITASVEGNGAASDNGVIGFDPTLQLQRPGLTLSNGKLYLAFGSHADYSNFHGWLMSYDASNLQHQISILNTTPNGWGSSIWQAGRALAIDDQGNLFASTGNGDYNGSSNFGESLLKISATDLSVLDWYTPENYADLNNNDWDFGSTGAILVPNTNLVLAGGKSGYLCLMQRDSLGGLQISGAHTAQEVEVNQNGVFNMALWANQNGSTVYLLEPLGALMAFPIANGQLGSTPLSQFLPNPASFYAGVAVSANGATSGTGIVWLTTGSGGLGRLHALDASNLSNELWNSDLVSQRDSLGLFSKFATPTIANGRVYVPTFSNALAVYGLLSSPPPATVPLSTQITNVVNGADYAASPVSPGELVTIFGTNLGPWPLTYSQTDANDRIATTLGGTQVWFDGILAPLMYTSGTQVGAIVPFGLLGSTTRVQVLYQGALTSSLAMPVAPATPALFSLDGTGTGPGAILNQDGSLNSPDNPASRGSVVVLYGTGAGAVNPSAVDGQLITAPPYPSPILPLTVSIGQQVAEVLYAGVAPGSVAGILQINILVPETAPTGPTVPVTFQVGDYASQSGITLAIQ